ncbi:MAG: leucine-rich repeat domain-containing protein [Bacteroidales bacterium]|nr:leucine-rich repeat domain-containing protein [Bacteroidales bacterium]
MKRLYLILLLILTISVQSTFAQISNRGWWDSLSPAWKQIIQKQELKGKVIEPTDEQLDRIVKIKFISCSFNENIVTLEPLAQFKLLETVQCNDCKNLKSLKGVENLLNLKELDCSNNDNINSLIPLQNIISLQKLNCGNTMVKDLRPLRKLRNLNSLDVHLTTVSELIFLKELTNLSSLNVSENYSLFKLDGIENLINLGELDLSKTQIRSIQPVANLKGLKSLNISHSPINSLRPLASPNNRKTLQEVDCSFTKIEGDQLDYLAQHYVLNMFRCRGNDLCPYDVEDFVDAMQKANPNCIIKIKASTNDDYIKANCE